MPCGQMESHARPSSATRSGHSHMKPKGSPVRTAPTFSQERPSSERSLSTSPRSSVSRAPRIIHHAPPSRQTLGSRTWQVQKAG